MARDGRAAHLEGRPGLAAGCRGRARLRPTASRRCWSSRTAAPSSSRSCATRCTTEPTRPRIIGKKDEHGRRLLSDLTELDAGADAARAGRAACPRRCAPTSLRARIARARRARRRRRPRRCTTATPLFLPGLPAQHLDPRAGGHARAGRHRLPLPGASYMDRNTDLFTHMGGEGMPWLGHGALRHREPHVFANIGDGTYGAFRHRWRCAPRSPRKANMTFKILVNCAVAMTGGQTPEGELDVPQHRRAGRAPRACSRIVDRLRRPGAPPRRPADARRASPSTTAASSTPCSASCARCRASPSLIYDQECATERRRKRKRGTWRRRPSAAS